MKRISENHDVHLCVIAKTFEEDLRNAKVMLKYCEDVRVFEAINVKNLPLTLLQEYPIQVLRNATKEVSKYVKRIVTSSNIHIIHVEGFYLMQHVPMENNIPVLLIEQNIEYLLWEQRSNYTAQLTKKFEYTHQYKMTKLTEIAAWNRSSLCAAVTEEDKGHIKKVLPHKDVKVVPNGVDHIPTLEMSHLAMDYSHSYIDKPSILFVGNFDYEPNVDAAFHLCHDIFPLIYGVIPEIKLFLVGNVSESEVKSLSKVPGVTVTGKLQSLIPYIKAADLFVCPLRIGGGIKTKMLEALYYGKAIVSSSIGVQGLPSVKNAPICVEDNPYSFASRVINLLQHPEERKKLEKFTVNLVNLLPSWNDAANELSRCYDTLVNG